MGRLSYYDTKMLCHSLIAGSGVYEAAGSAERLPVGVADENARFVPLRNIFSGEYYFVKWLSLHGALTESIRVRILNPPDRKLIVWPSDLIRVDEASPVQTNICAANIYDELSLSPSPEETSFGLLFPYREYPPADPLGAVLEQVELSGSRGWQNPRLRRIAVKLTETILELNRCGYYYFDFTPSRILVDINDGVFLDYSPLAIPRWELELSDAALREENLTMHPSEYPLEFAEPALVQGVCRQADERMQNYSLAAFLFWMLFGSYAYDGRLVEFYPERDAMEHYTKFRQYHKKPVFVFDPDDQSNRLGAMDIESDQGAMHLWAAAPEKLKKMFLSVLREDNATRASSSRCLTPESWLRLFSELGWHNEKEQQSGK